MTEQSFACPNCGAPLDHPKGDQPTVRCPYCHTSVIVPEELRTPKVVVTHIPVHHVQQASTGRSPAAGCLAVFFVVLLLVGGVMFMLPNLLTAQITNAVVSEASFPGQQAVEITSTPSPTPTRTPTVTPTPAFMQAAFTFGRKGIDEGMFEDARYIAVDGNDRIYVADYQGGRVQVFDTQGKYLYQWNVGGKNTILHGMTASYQGEVFLTYDRAIYRYDGATGKELGSFVYVQEPGGEFGDLVILPDGRLAGVWYEQRWGMITSLRGHRDDLVVFTPDGKVDFAVESFISSQTEAPALDTLLAVDGKGYLYALSTFDGMIFKFSPEGEYLDHFGEPGSEPGQIGSASTLAIDGKGRVYIGGSRSVSVFSAEGRYITSFPTDVSVSMMVFDTQDQLWAVSRDQVTRLDFSRQE